MATITKFTLEYSTNYDANNPGAATWNMIDNNISKDPPYSYTHTLNPSPSIWYRLTGITDDVDLTIPYNIVVVSNSFGFVKKFGSTGSDYAQCCTLSPDGGIIIAGSFQGTVDFSGTGNSITSAGLYDIFIAKFALNGTHLWSKAYGAAGNEAVRSVSCDSNGNIFICGVLDGGMVAKFNSTGVFQWVAGPDPADNVPNKTAEARASNTDASGNVIVVGKYSAGFANQMDFGDGNLLYSNYNSLDVFTAKYDTSGTCLFAKTFVNGGGEESAECVACSENDSIYVAGYSNSPGMVIGTSTSSSASGFLVKYNSSGTLQWGRFLATVPPNNGGGPGRVFTLRLTDAGNVIVAGYFAKQYGINATELGGQTGDAGNSIIYGSALNVDVFFASYAAATGYFQWGKPFRGSNYQRPAGLAVNASGEIAIVGTFRGSCDFGGQTLLSGPDADVGYVARFNSIGTLLWAKSLVKVTSGFEPNALSGVSLDNNGNTYVVGGFPNTVNFKDTSLTSAGSSDVIFASLSSNGD